jgi:hypothetical protein
VIFLAGILSAQASTLLEVERRPCVDPHLPALAGDWVVTCQALRPGWATSLLTGEKHRLDARWPWAGLGPNLVFSLAPEGGLLWLGEATVPAHVRTVDQEQVAMPTSDGLHAAALTETSVEALSLSTEARWSHPAAPLGWYPPALAWPAVAWVEQAETEDIWWTPDATTGMPTLLAGGPAHQRHVVGAGGWLAWVDGGDLVRMDVATGGRTRIHTDTGFSAPPTLTEGGELCWEVRDRGDVDILCSDGFALREPGHQTWPSRVGDRLLYREGDALRLVVLPTPPATP